MEYLVTAFVGIFNFIESGKAKAVSLFFIGLAVSFFIFKFIPHLFELAYFLYPNSKQHVFEHQLYYKIGLFLIIIFPSFYCARISYYWLSFIYERESSRRI
jgi:hypothetical protein